MCIVCTLRPQRPPAMIRAMRSVSSSRNLRRPASNTRHPSASRQHTRATSSSHQETRMSLRPVTPRSRAQRSCAAVWLSIVVKGDRVDGEGRYLTPSGIWPSCAAGSTWPVSSAAHASTKPSAQRARAVRSLMLENAPMRLSSVRVVARSRCASDSYSRKAFATGRAAGRPDLHHLQPGAPPLPGRAAGRPSDAGTRWWAGILQGLGIRV